MRDVVVIGGGLSGLAACYELEKHPIHYTLIEVKKRLGGSIVSTAAGGFIADASAFAIAGIEDLPLFGELGLDQDRFEFEPGQFGFCGGTGSLTGALAQRLTGARLMRMAVSSIGRVDGRFTLCLENGLLLDAGAVIVAAPARYAERMLFNLAPDLSDWLRGYDYDSIRRVSLGYHKRDLPRRRIRPYSVIYPFVFATDSPGRVPDADHLLLQVGVRASSDLSPGDLIAQVLSHYGCDENPLFAQVDRWNESDPLSCYDDDHAATVSAIRARLPEGISLIGSDYCLGPPQKRGVARIDERLRQGRAAARAALDFLSSEKRS
ncbi:MAG: FAD-dependent oxidoreductase [Chloroflexi bacterium]|nr:FAD-dependent oxidoreductase [Chloroflexota bacterium]